MNHTAHMFANMAGTLPLNCRDAGCEGAVSFRLQAATRTWGFVGKYHITDEWGDGLCCSSVVDEPEVAPPREATLVCKRAPKMLERERLDKEEAVP